MECEIENCEMEIPEPEYCCSGRECGCGGMPSNPPYCETCLDIIQPFDINAEERIEALESGYFDNVIVIHRETPSDDM